VLNLQKINLEPSDVNSVEKMEDEEIKEELVQIFKLNENLDEVEKLTLSQEKTKSHGGGEISDFDLKISRNEENDIWVSFPIKSASEANNRRPKKLVQSNLHQILRPFGRFDLCVVFPILITDMNRSTTLNLQEMVKSLNSQQDYPIKIIDKKSFARILKADNRI